MSHSLNTAQQYYQAPTMEDTYGAYEAMQGIMAGSSATSLPPLMKGKGKGKAKAMQETGDKEAEEVSTLKRKRPDEVGEQVVSPQKRRKFTSAQENVLAKHFATHISTHVMPAAKECKEFLQMYSALFEGRRVKDIYDKCRNMSGRYL